MNWLNVATSPPEVSEKEYLVYLDGEYLKAKYTNYALVWGRAENGDLVKVKNKIEPSWVRKNAVIDTPSHYCDFMPPDIKAP